jgi:hypothetical protein
MPLIMIGGAPGSVGPPPGNHFFASYLGTAENDTDSQASYSFSIDIGANDAGRQVIVVLCWANGSTASLPASLTIGNDSSPVLDKEVQHVGASPPRYGCSIYRGVPTDTGVVNIVATPTVADWQYVSVFVYRTTDPVVPFQTAGLNCTGAGTAPRPTNRAKLEVPAGGFVIAGAPMCGGTDHYPSVAWSSNVINDGYNDGSVSSSYCDTTAAHLNNHPGQTIEEITVSGRANQILAAVAYGAVDDTPTIDWKSVFNTTAIISDVGNTWSKTGKTVRITLPAARLSNLPTSPNKLRLTLVAPATASGQGTKIASMYVGHKAAGTDDAVALTQVTFAGGSTSIQLEPADVVITDVIDFNYDGTSDLIFSYYCDGDSTHDVLMTFTVTGARTSDKTGDEANVLDVTGFDGGDYGSNVHGLVMAIEMGVSAP